VPGQQLGGVGEEMEQSVAQMRELLDGAGSAFGGVGVLAEPALQSLQQGPFAEVTPFGRYALARVLRGHGLTVPTLGDLAGAPPGELLEALCAHDPAAAAEEIRVWLDARGEGWESAVREIVRSAAVKDESGPVRRLTLPTLIGVVAVAAGPMLREWQADPWLAAAVAVGRFAAGQGPQPTAEQFLWLAVDAMSMSMSMSLDEEEDFAELAERVQVEPMLAEPGGIAAALRLDHPQTREVLRRVAGCLDDRKLAARLRRGLGR
jgi:hypothetical protein